MKFQLIISTPLSAKLIASRCFKKCEVMIGEVKTWVDLIKLEGVKYDAILGMDWLSTHHAHVDCYHKRMIFKMKGIPKFTFDGVKSREGTLIISAFKATKLLWQGCQGLLAVVMNKEGTVLKLEDIVVVKEYPDVFSEELAGLPPDRGIEFSVDLLPRSSLISTVPIGWLQ